MSDSNPASSNPPSSPLANRSMPDATVIPELAYEDVRAAVTWLVTAFGFVERLRIGGHRVQLVLGNGAIVATQRSGHGDDVGIAPAPSTLMVRVANVAAHHARAVRAGARILQPPSDFPYGERQYTALDPGGHRWTFLRLWRTWIPAIGAANPLSRAWYRSGRLRLRLRRALPSSGVLPW